MTGYFVFKVAGLLVTIAGSVLAAANGLLDKRYARRALWIGLGLATVGGVLTIVLFIADQRQDARAAAQAEREARRLANPIEDMTAQFSLSVDAKQPDLIAYESRVRSLLTADQLHSRSVWLSADKSLLPDAGEGGARVLLMPSQALILVKLPDSPPGRPADLVMNAQYHFDWDGSTAILGKPVLTYDPGRRIFRLVMPAEPVAFAWSSHDFSSLEDFSNSRIEFIGTGKAVCDVELTLTTKRGRALDASFKHQPREKLQTQLSNQPWQ